MKCYLDITILPSADITLYFLWKKLYQQIHLALVEAKDDNNKVGIGASFPQYKDIFLGHKLRLFAKTESELSALNLNKWLHRLSDYVHITSIKSVPDSITCYVSFYRINKRKSNEEKAQKTSERLGISFEEALEKLKGRSEEPSNAPYIYMTSLSSKVEPNECKHRFRLVIGKQEKSDNKPSNSGKFCTYGLSKTATVPWFD